MTRGLQYSINITFICPGKTKSVCDFLYGALSSSPQWAGTETTASRRSPVQSALRSCGFHICGFNQRRSKIFGKKCYSVADAYCVVRPMTVVSVLSMY